LASSKQKGLHNTILQQTLYIPSVVIEECMTTGQEEVDWISKIKGVLEDQEVKKKCRDLAIAKKVI